MNVQRGAALTETFVLMLVLTPIMFGVPMIGKLIDLRQTTVQASRYAAWEATVSPNTHSPDNIKARFFSDNNVALGGDASAPNVLWGGYRDDEQAVELPEVSRQTVDSYWQPAHAEVRLDESSARALPYTSAYDAGANDDVAYKIQDLIETTVGAVADVTDGKWMDSGSLKGMLRSEVQAQVAENGWFNALPFKDATVIMYDNWSSPDDNQAARRVQSMVPAAALEDVANTFSEFGNFPLFKELKSLDEAFGHIDMEPLPAGESPFVEDSRVQRRHLQPYEE